MFNAYVLGRMVMTSMMLLSNYSLTLAAVVACGDNMITYTLIFLFGGKLGFALGPFGAMRLIFVVSMGDA